MNSFRQCISCKAKTEKSSLIRIAFVEEGGYFDFLQEGVGRGLYVHPAGKCLDKKVFEANLIRAIKKAFIDKNNLACEFHDLKEVYQRGRNKISQMIFKEDLVADLTKNQGKKNKKYSQAKACIELVDLVINQEKQVHNESSVRAKKQIRL